jgi:hypothetical protein
MGEKLMFDTTWRKLADTILSAHVTKDYSQILKANMELGRLGPKAHVSAWEYKRDESGYSLVARAVLEAVQNS